MGIIVVPIISNEMKEIRMEMRENLIGHSCDICE